MDNVCKLYTNVVSQGSFDRERLREEVLQSVQVLHSYVISYKH